MKLIQNFGADKQKCFCCDTNGVIYPGRQDGMNDFKLTLANSTITRATSLTEICKGADVLIGVSGAGAFTKEMLLNLNERPIIFALANPEPEIRPELAK